MKTLTKLLFIVSIFSSNQILANFYNDDNGFIFENPVDPPVVNDLEDCLEPFILGGH